MKKEFLKRALIGFPIGIAIGCFIPIFISYTRSGGKFYPCDPQLVSAIGSETNAILLQTLLDGVIGIVFAGASVVWNIDSWSMVKQAGVYFLITAGTFMPIAYALYWMEHTPWGILSYSLIFVLIFISIWVSCYFSAKKSVRNMNEKLKGK